MRLFEFKFAATLCRWFDHKWDEFHMYDVVCSRCRICREYTEQDRVNLALKAKRK